MQKVSCVPICAYPFNRNAALYLTNSLNADISFMVRAGCAVFDLAGHGEEEVKIFCSAVQLADVFIYTGHTKTLVSFEKVVEV